MRLGWAPEVCEAAAAAAVDAAAEVAGRRSRRVTFRRTHAAVARRGANGHLGDIKSLSWSAFGPPPFRNGGVLKPVGRGLPAAAGDWDVDRQHGGSPQPTHIPAERLDVA